MRQHMYELTSFSFISPQLGVESGLETEPLSNMQLQLEASSAFHIASISAVHGLYVTLVFHIR